MSGPEVCNSQCYKLLRGPLGQIQHHPECNASKPLIDADTVPYGTVQGSWRAMGDPQRWQLYAEQAVPASPEVRRHEAIEATQKDAANLRDNLAINAARGVPADVIELVRKHFRSEGQWLRCLRCGMKVTWITKHCKERHGDPVQVISDPGRSYEGELW